jgi:hypothetical protein
VDDVVDDDEGNVKGEVVFKKRKRTAGTQRKVDKE